MRMRITEIDERAIPYVACDKAAKLLDLLRDAAVKSADYVTQILRVELRGDCRRLCKVIEHDCQHAQFSRRMTMRLISKPNDSWLGHGLP